MTKAASLSTVAVWRLEGNVIGGRVTVQQVVKRARLCCNTGIGEEVTDVKKLRENRLVINALGMDGKREEGQRQAPKTQKPTKKR